MLINLTIRTSLVKQMIENSLSTIHIEIKIEKMIEIVEDESMD